MNFSIKNVCDSKCNDKQKRNGFMAHGSPRLRSLDSDKGSLCVSVVVQARRDHERLFFHMGAQNFGWNKKR